VAPLALETTAFGWVPTGIMARCAGSAPLMSTTDMVFAPWLVT